MKGGFPLKKAEVPFQRSDRQDLNSAQTNEKPWYAGVTRYQWLVLTIASLGWVFDIFEGQIFVASMREAMDAA